MRTIVASGLIAFSLSSPADLQAQSDLTVALHANGFSRPVAIVQDPTNRTVQFVVEQAGRIRVVQGGTVLPTDFLNLSGAISSGGERGLLGLAFGPDYPTSGRFFVNFTNSAGHTVVARFLRSANPLVASPGTRFDLRWDGPSGPAYIAQPFANHNGGHLAFGPDGYLYIGLGDGGGGGDPQNHAQTPSSLLGKMLRVDVNVPETDPIGYRVPPDNPFVSSGPPQTRPEIWAFGFRNPWRYSFDPPSRGGTGALIVGDVGQASREEIDYEPAGRGGRNYGWRNREGTQPYNESAQPAYTPLIAPVFEYDRTVGVSITGGYVYRGTWLPAVYRGRYFFGDFGRGRIFSLGLSLDANGEATAAGLTEHTAALQVPYGPLGVISSFGVDADGEIFIVGYGSGAILRIVSTAPPGAPTGFRRTFP